MILLLYRMICHFDCRPYRPCASLQERSLWNVLICFYCMSLEKFSTFSSSASASHARRLRVVDGLHRDVDGLRILIDNLSELCERKLSICLSYFRSLFRYLFLFLIRLSAKPTKLPKFLNHKESSRELDVPGSCPVSCHGECSHCALM